MLSLLILIGLALLVGYFLGRGKVGERIQNWYAGLRGPKEAEPVEGETDSGEE